MGGELDSPCPSICAEWSHTADNSEPALSREVSAFFDLVRKDDAEDADADEDEGEGNPWLGFDNPSKTLDWGLLGGKPRIVFAMGLG